MKHFSEVLGHVKNEPSEHCKISEQNPKGFFFNLQNIEKKANRA